MGDGNPYIPNRTADEGLLGVVQAPTFEQPPGGSINTVLAWAGDDPLRLRAALGVEKRRAQPRKSLISRLKNKLGVL